jgi:hypothetical protein
MAASCHADQNRALPLWIADEVTGKRRKTSYRMDRETALERYPDAEPDPSSSEVRPVYQPGKEVPPQYGR